MGFVLVIKNGNKIMDKYFIKEISLPETHKNLPRLVIIRGLPGSGKTTMAKRDFPNYLLVEADMYFIENGEYKYNPKKIKAAHEWCFNTVRCFLEAGFFVVVANTFTRRWEFQKYIDLGYNYQIIVANGQFESVHNVPKHIIEQMRARWED